MIWMDEEKADKLSELLLNLKTNCFINYDGRSINTADCTGIYLPEDISNMTRRKNGEWQDMNGKWHEKGEKYSHEDAVIDKIINK